MRYWSNEEIDLGTRKEIAAINERFIAALRKGTIEDVRPFFLDQARDNIEKEMGFERFISAARQACEPETWAIYGEHHVKVQSGGRFNPTLVYLRGEEPYTVVLPAFTGEMYVSLLRFLGAWREPALHLVYLKQPEGWKLGRMEVGGVFSLGGKSAVAWYREARQLSERKMLFPAIRRIDAALRCLRPAQSFQFTVESEVRTLASQLAEKGRQSFSDPIVLSEIRTRPTLYRFDTSFHDKGIVPVVDYATTIPLDETSRLESEAEEVGQATALKFPGLCEGHELIMLRAFERLPTDPKQQYRSYGIEKPCRYGERSSEPIPAESATESGESPEGKGR